MIEWVIDYKSILYSWNKKFFMGFKLCAVYCRNNDTSLVVFNSSINHFYFTKFIQLFYLISLFCCKLFLYLVVIWHIYEYLYPNGDYWGRQKIWLLCLLYQLRLDAKIKVVIGNFQKHENNWNQSLPLLKILKKNFLTDFTKMLDTFSCEV